MVKHHSLHRRGVSLIPTRNILEKFCIREIWYHRSLTLEKDETWEGGQKTPISSEIIDVENDKLMKKSLLSELSDNVNGLPTEMFNFIEVFRYSWCIVPNINVINIGTLFHLPGGLVLRHLVILTEELTCRVTVYCCCHPYCCWRPVVTGIPDVVGPLKWCCFPSVTVVLAVAWVASIEASLLLSASLLLLTFQII
jgi:hypothetical protein